MPEETNKSPASHEEHFNPPPMHYRVPFAVKVFFIVMMLAAFGYLVSVIVARHQVQNRFLTENYMAPIDLKPSPLPQLLVVDPKTNEQHSLIKLCHGKWVLVNLWATWCHSCQREMPSLAMLSTTLSPQLSILAVSVDETIAPVVDFVKAQNPNFTVLWDAQKQAPGLFKVNKFPETFLVSPTGEVVVQFSGPRDWATAEAIKYFKLKIMSSHN